MFICNHYTEVVDDTMLETNVTIRGVDSKLWKEFQAGIVSLHGNLYGNIGQEATQALKLWLERYAGMKAVTGIPAERLSISYNDIGGLKEEIKLIKESVEIPLRHPELYCWLDLIPPKGVLIHGPQGTGKNILARAATAGARAWLYILRIEQLVTQSNDQWIMSIFQRAKETAPSVILIPDLAVLLNHQQRFPEVSVEQNLTWLYTEIDALEDFKQVIVIGITFAPEALDPEFRKRFQREIEVSLPDKKGRFEILKILTKKMPLAENVSLEEIVEMTDQQEGATLRQITQDAATQALRRALEKEKIPEEEIPKKLLERIKVEMDDFIQAIKSQESAR